VIKRNHWGGIRFILALHFKRGSSSKTRSVLTRIYWLSGLLTGQRTDHPLNFFYETLAANEQRRKEILLQISGNRIRHRLNGDRGGYPGLRSGSNQRTNSWVYRSSDLFSSTLSLNIYGLPLVLKSHNWSFKAVLLNFCPGI
jgi:hypothetical protein